MFALHGVRVARRRFRGGVVRWGLLAAFIAGLLAAGCEITSPSDSNMAPAPEPEPMDRYVPHAGLDGGEAVYTASNSGADGFYTIRVPDRTWDPYHEPARLYMLQQGVIYSFTATGLMLDDDDRGYVGVLAVAPAGTPEQVAGPVFWCEDQGPALQRVQLVHVSDEVRAAITAAVDSTGERPDTTTVSIRSLGANSGVGLYWASAKPEHLVYEYNPDAAPLPAWLVLVDAGGEAQLTTVMRAPGGFSSDRLSPADMNGDGLADLVCVGLYAPGSPTRAFLLASDNQWHWVAEF